MDKIIINNEKWECVDCGLNLCGKKMCPGCGNDTYNRSKKYEKKPLMEKAFIVSLGEQYFGKLLRVKDFNLYITRLKKDLIKLEKDNHPIRIDMIIKLMDKRIGNESKEVKE